MRPRHKAADYDHLDVSDSGDEDANRHDDDEQDTNDAPTPSASACGRRAYGLAVQDAPCSPSPVERVIVIEDRNASAAA